MGSAMSLRGALARYVAGGGGISGMTPRERGARPLSLSSHRACQQSSQKAPIAPGGTIGPQCLMQTSPFLPQSLHQ